MIKNKLRFPGFLTPLYYFFMGISALTLFSSLFISNPQKAAPL